jgi:hypothetical protein
MQKDGKRIVREAEQPKIYHQNMDLDADLESILYNLNQPTHTIHHDCSMDMVGTGIFDADESFVFQSVVFETE